MVRRSKNALIGNKSPKVITAKNVKHLAAKKGSLIVGAFYLDFGGRP